MLAKGLLGLSDDCEAAGGALAAGPGRSVRRALRFAHENGMQFRVTELNSVSCGGNAGVADSFATALWAPDALLS